MRLDLFLKASRICPRRTVAQQLCEAGSVLVNGTPAKPAHDIKSNDELVVRRRDRVSTYRVLSVPQRNQTSKQDARGLYELIKEETIDVRSEA
jgi:ribosomal 50S subunit-recycling heat shock protein